MLSHPICQTLMFVFSRCEFPLITRIGYGPVAFKGKPINKKSCCAPVVETMFGILCSSELLSLGGYHGVETNDQKLEEQRNDKSATEAQQRAQIHEAWDESPTRNQIDTSRKTHKQCTTFGKSKRRRQRSKAWKAKGKQTHTRTIKFSHSGWTSPSIAKVCIARSWTVQLHIDLSLNIDFCFTLVLNQNLNPDLNFRLSLKRSWSSF
jgi:hypothetical protein